MEKYTHGIRWEQCESREFNTKTGHSPATILARANNPSLEVQRARGTATVAEKQEGPHTAVVSFRKFGALGTVTGAP